ncbi:MAG: DUF1801 domain-containing protein [Chloroflexi bacterium]|nr:MAG: DUF1801 domain-containing protein [Chloroflexota bacterium]
MVVDPPGALARGRPERRDGGHPRGADPGERQAPRPDHRPHRHLVRGPGGGRAGERARSDDPGRPCAPPRGPGRRGPPRQRRRRGPGIVAATQPGTLDADVDRLLAEHPPELQAIERALRATIRREFPEAVEQVDFGNKLIAFGRSMKMRGLLFAIIAHKTWVNLQLADGAELPDPDGIIEGTGKRIRHVKVRSVADASSVPFVRAIRAQLAAHSES